MRRLFFVLGLGSFAAGCSAILGLPDVVLDNTINRDAGSSDVVAKPDQGALDAPADTFVDDAPFDSGADVPKIPIALTTGNRPWGLAIDDMYVFWSEPFNFVIGSVNKDGSGVKSLATGSMYAFGVRSIAADGTDVYWARLDSAVYKCARTGCNNSPTAIVQNLTNSAFAIAIDNTNVYYAEDTSYGIYRTPKVGGNEMLVASLAARATELVVVGSTIYATLDNGSLVSVPTSGGTPNVIVPPGASSLLGLFIQNNFAYYAVFNDPGQIAFTGLDGGAMPLALMQRYPFGITGDMNDIYWTNTVTLGPNGNVSKCSIAQCVSPTKVADLQDTPKWIRNDQSAIYWTNAGNSNNSGGVMKLIK